MSDKQFKITNNPSFYGFLISNIISTFGDGLRVTILPLVILDITKYPHLMGLTYTLSYVVFIIATPFSGFIVDKIKKKSSLIISDISRGILIGSVPLILIFLPSFSVIWIIIVFVGITIGETIFRPAALSIIPELIEEKSIDRTNALLQSSKKVSSMTGMICGGLLYSFLKFSSVLYIDAISFFISAFIVMFSLRFDEKSYLKKEEKAEVSFKSFINDTTVVLNFIKSSKLIMVLLISGIIMNFFSSPIAIFMPIFSKYSFSLAGTSYGILNAFQSLGLIVAGSMLFFRKSKLNRKLLFSSGISGEGLCMFILGLVTPLLLKKNEFSALAISSITMFLMGISYAILNIPVDGWFQSHVPKNLRGKVFSLKDMILTIPMPVAFIIFGYLLESINVYSLLIFIGLMTIIVGLTTYVTLKPKAPSAEL